MDFCYLRLLLILALPASPLYSQTDASQTNDVNRSASIVKRAEENPLQTFDPDMVIQVGAFRNESNALALKERLSHLLNKPLILVPADGFYKVRITGFTSQEDLEKIIPALAFLGIKNIWVFRPVSKADVITSTDLQTVASDKAASDKKNTPESAVQPDPALKTVEEKIILSDLPIKDSVISENPFSLQVGVFHGKSRALRAQRKITTKLNLPVEILNEWEYYIVIIPGFKTREEIFKYYPVLAALGYPNSIIIEHINIRKP